MFDSSHPTNTWTLWGWKNDEKFSAGTSYKKSGSKITCSIFRGNENTMHDRLEIILCNRQTEDLWTVICWKCKAAHPSSLLPFPYSFPSPLFPCLALLSFLFHCLFPPPKSYLRVWSRELDTPVVSIDYSLAPEAPFPRSLNECVMAYAWILQHLDQLGGGGHTHIIQDIIRLHNSDYTCCNIHYRGIAKET